MDSSEVVCEHTKREREQAALRRQQMVITEALAAHEVGHAYDVAGYDRNLLQAAADHVKAEIALVERSLGKGGKEAITSHPELAQTLRMMKENLADIEHQIEVISARILLLAQLLD